MSQERNAGSKLGIVIVGGTGGAPFDDLITSPRGRISQIRGREGSWVDAFGFDEVDVVTGVPTSHPLRGGTGGREIVYPPLDDWYYINGIYVEYGSYIDYIKLFVWNQATQRQELPITLGKSKPGLRNYTLVFNPTPDGKPPKEIYGFAGRSGTYLDAIGVYVRDHHQGPPV